MYVNLDHEPHAGDDYVVVEPQIVTPQDVMDQLHRAAILETLLPEEAEFEACLLENVVQRLNQFVDYVYTVQVLDQIEAGMDARGWLSN